MKQTKRQIYILELIKVNGEVLTKDLSTKLNVSSMTITRDLKALAHTGAVKLIYGGAISCEMGTSEYPMALKEEANIDGKKRIATHCKYLVKPGSSVFIETGTTTLAVAKEIFRTENCTFYTNSLLALNALSKFNGIALHTVPGKYRDLSQGFLGLQVVEYVKNFQFDIAFIGTEGIDLNSGISLPNEEDAYTKKAIMQQAKKVIMVADQTKFGLTHLYKASELEEIDLIVTDLSDETPLFKAIAEITDIISVTSLSH
ncbi:DeoR/GlpR family DNA-binding transcription regulator [Buttiauxella gaviniae]|uniref:DeoR/GlpR family DNA-binding transcription regulator n=1 Tax=Buttiauxella gaviniae TaxID=82990 RepID=UPI003BB50031